MKKIILLHSAVLVPTLFLFWLLAYRNTMWWMEGMSFFSSLPDFAILQARLPGGVVKYAAAFLLQFYHSSVMGALLQTLFAWIVMVCADVVAWRLLRRVRYSWLAMLPVAVFVALQCRYRDAEGAIVWCLVSAAVALITVFLTRRPRRYVAVKRGRLRGGVLLPLALVAVGIVVSLVYFLTPIDLIPDAVPGIGQLDDAAVILFAVKAAHNDIADYKKWKGL